MSAFYESEAAVAQYLLFHYGTPEQICPLLPEARTACGFPARCVTESMRLLAPNGRARALDLGCAVGRSSLELSAYFDAVIGIDFSARFISTAQTMRDKGLATARAPAEGEASDELKVCAPESCRAERIRFEVGDACALRSDLGSFDFVLMANLIDRLPDPAVCLRRVPELVSAGGTLVITSPYTWLEEYTPREKWLGTDGHGTLAALKNLLVESFEFHGAFDWPFLIREHRRKYQWSIAEASLWRRR